MLHTDKTARFCRPRITVTVSTPELDFLVDWAHNHKAFGARLIGGGFGGVTLHLVPDEIKADYIAGIVAAYRTRFNRTATVTEVHPGPGAKELNHRT